MLLFDAKLVYVEQISWPLTPLGSISTNF